MQDNPQKKVEEESRVEGGFRNSPDDTTGVGATGKWGQGGLTGSSVPSNHRADWITENLGKVAILVLILLAIGIFAWFSQ